MKKNLLHLAVLLTFVLVSCEKKGEFNLFDKKEKACSTVKYESLPENLKTNFKTKYPNAEAVTWFDKDGKAFTAVFKISGANTISTFDKNGDFKSETSDDEDNNDNDCGCEIEIED